MKKLYKETIEDSTYHIPVAILYHYGSIPTNRSLSLTTPAQTLKLKSTFEELHELTPQILRKIRLEDLIDYLGDGLYRIQKEEVKN